MFGDFLTVATHTAQKLYVSQSHTSLNFYYNNHLVTQIGQPYFLYYNRSSKRALAYVDTVWCEKQRDRHFTKHCTKQSNLAFYKSNVQGQDEAFDPLYLAIIIALAQRLKRDKSKSKSTTLKVCLFVFIRPRP